MILRFSVLFRLIAAAVLLATSPLALAKDFSSPFGYHIKLPDHWRVFSRDDVMQNSGQLSRDARSELKGWNPQVVSAVERQISTGNVEVFFNMKTSNTRFADNINVMRSRGRVPSSSQEGEQACTEAGRSLPQVLGRPIDLHDCGYRTINGFDALYMNITVRGAPYRTVQYMLNVGKTQPLLFTLTVKHDDYYGLKREFDTIIQSLRVN